MNGEFENEQAAFIFPLADPHLMAEPNENPEQPNDQVKEGIHAGNVENLQQPITDEEVIDDMVEEVANADPNNVGPEEEDEARGVNPGVLSPLGHGHQHHHFYVSVHLKSGDGIFHIPTFQAPSVRPPHRRRTRHHFDHSNG